MTALVAYNDNNKRYIRAELLCKSLKLHCFKCGFVLVNLRPETQGTIWDKCTKTNCRTISRFIQTNGKVRLFTNKVLNGMTDKELQPYSRDDMLGLVI